MAVMDAAQMTYEEKALHFLGCGLTESAQVMATLAVVEQLKIMNDHNKYGDRSKLRKDMFLDRDVI